MSAAPELVRLESPADLARDGAVEGETGFDAASLARAAPDATWVLAAGGQPARARCSLWWTRTPSLDGRPTGLVGHYAARDTSSARRLLDHACAELAARDGAVAVGPMDGSTWRRYRLVVEKGQEPVFFLEPDNPAEWADHFRAAGFETLATYTSALSEDVDVSHGREAAAAARFAARGVRIRPFDPSRSDDDLRRIYRVSIDSFTDNFLYTPIGEEDYLELYRPLLPHVPSGLVLLAEREGDPVGFVFGYPDLNRARRGAPVDTVVIKTVARRPGRQWVGLGSVLVAELNRRARDLGFRRVIHALMHESNVSRNMSAHLQGRTIRRYALFARTLAP